jgi:ABC-type transporter Mla subunit MlaD
MPWHTVALNLAPLLVDLAKAALPAFTKRKDVAPPEIQAQTTQQQITELQAAVTQNAENIRTLAADLKTTAAALSDGGKEIDARFRRLERLLIVAVAVAAVACVSALALWLH